MGKLRAEPLETLPMLPPLPGWIVSAPAETPEAAAFRSGAALAHLGQAMASGDVPLALWRDRLALAAAGHTRSSIQEAVVERAVVSGAVLGASAATMGSVDPDREYSCFASPEDLVVFVAGGGGLYSAAFASWCAGPNRNRSVSMEIEVGQACEIPGFA